MQKKENKHFLLVIFYQLLHTATADIFCSLNEKEGLTSSEFSKKF
jgi:hypothetical protein